MNTSTSPTVKTALTIEPIGGEGPMPVVQLVSPTGELTALGETLGVDVPFAKGLYRDMARARALDREALALQRQGELSLWLMSWGQEAAQVGSIRALWDTDMVFPSYREHAAALCRGVTPQEIMMQWRGVRHAGWRSDETRFHINSLVLGTQTLHAVGYAAGAAIEGTDEVVAAYFGDGAASQGDVNEAFNWAATMSLPVLFFCQNNQWAISTPTSKQMRAPLHRRAAGFGLNAFHVDGNDVLAVHAVTSRAAELIRDGAGPALIEAQTYRLAGHSSSDDPKRYRDEAELEEWRQRDPIRRLELLLLNLDTPESWFTELDVEVKTFAEEVRAACRAITVPDLDELFEHAYAEPHASLEREREQRRTLMASLTTAEER